VVGGSKKRRKKRMSRRSVVLVICLAAALTVTAFTDTNASPARVAGLNLSGPGTGFVRDYVNTYPYPVAINRYPNMLWAHLGKTSSSLNYPDNRMMGMFHELGEDGEYGILGVTLRENSPEDMLLRALDDVGADYSGVSHQQFDIIYGRDMEQASFGLRFDLARSSYEDANGNVTAPDETYIGLDGWVNTWGIGAAVDVDISEDAMLEVGGEVRQFTFKDDATGLQDDGSISVRVNGRIFYEMAENKTLIPVVSFQRLQIGEENGVVLADKVNDFYGGVAVNQMVNGDDLLIYGAAARFSSWKRENDVVDIDQSRMQLPVLFMALEHQFRDWLVGRGGASQALTRWKGGDEDPDFADQKELFNEFDFSLGIGMEFSDFTIDATLNQNYPFTGFWFVSGQPTNNLFGMVSFTYTY
jgi:hypothetical protein